MTGTEPDGASGQQNAQALGLTQHAGLTVVDHPLVWSKLAAMASRACDPARFRALAEEIMLLVAFEATANLALADGRVDQRDVVLAPVLRSGLVLCGGFQRLMPLARMAHLGIFNDYNSREVNVYFASLPAITERSTIYIFDAVIGTGASVAKAIEMMTRGKANTGGLRLDPSQIRIVSLTAHTLGLEAITAESGHTYPHVYTCHIETEVLDDGRPYLLLGNVSDRAFGIK